jgi:hypothetical protein
MTDGAGIDRPVWDVVYLVSCAMGGVPADAGRVEKMDLDAVYRVSQRHLLVSVCATALESAGVSDERFARARGMAVRKAVLMDTERAELFRRMDAAGIWHLPLKGCVLQGLYPSYGMRQMADNDILFDAERADGMRLSDEDFYVYLVAHEYKHFVACGTGLRSLLDAFVWLRAKVIFEHDFERAGRPRHDCGIGRRRCFRWYG